MRALSLAQHGAPVAACHLIANGSLRRHVETTLSLCCWRFLLMLTTHMPEACLLMGKAYLGPNQGISWSQLCRAQCEA